LAPKASEENERTTIVENKVFGSILYRQMGALAEES
jgi:phosphatidylserine decarboxylase